MHSECRNVRVYVGRNKAKNRDQRLPALIHPVRPRNYKNLRDPVLGRVLYLLHNLLLLCVEFSHVPRTLFIRLIFLLLPTIPLIYLTRDTSHCILLASPSLIQVICLRHFASSYD